MSDPNAYRVSTVAREAGQYGRLFANVEVGHFSVSDGNAEFTKVYQFKVSVPSGREGRAQEYVDLELGRRRLTHLGRVSVPDLEKRADDEEIHRQLTLL